ncbi:shikimate kinase [Pelobium manganitolerans]|uniref:Shikimate kinase n=1 Tax=Pelobium manganitolerans TaxID=1842495 RepID=A0A419S9R0_9SPHI|nr:shikimate kinase [Pelobium manganitolerans]RKD18618.1 shikimate kinase [Pelobium manganitolerans]
MDLPTNQAFSKPIYLIGFMGCGKSKLGKALAVKTGANFLDLDDLVVAQNQMTIPELFAAFGENGFREREKKTLQDGAFSPNSIIATGGGAPCFFDNMEWMNSNGITVFIDPPVKVLADRLINARVERPLIKGKSHEELIEFITQKLNERRPFYQQAQVLLKGVDLNADDVLQALNPCGN